MDEETNLDNLGYAGEGTFKSPLPEYTGSFSLAHPFYGRHYKAWLRATREVTTDDDPIEGLTVFTEWRGFVAILVDWNIAGVAKSDVTPDGDNVPEQLKFWCRTCMVEYLAAQFDPKCWQGPREIMS